MTVTEIISRVNTDLQTPRQFDLVVMTVTEIISRVNTDLQTPRQLSKRHTLNKSINLEMMPLLSWLLNPQLISLCQCRFVARLPPGGSSFLKPSMRPAQMTSPTSRYPYCQKMARPQKDLCDLSPSSFFSAESLVGRASTPS
jgi:hypothetical protein